MCPACIGSTLLLLAGATSTGGLAAFIAGRAFPGSRSGDAPIRPQASEAPSNANRAASARPQEHRPESENRL